MTRRVGGVGSPADIGIGSWPARRARMAPDRTALRQDDTVLTYAELATRVDAVAAGLAGHGVGPGDRVAWLGPNDIAAFELLFATTGLGALFVPLNMRLSPGEVGWLLGDCEPTVLVHGPAQAGLVPRDAAPHVLDLDAYAHLAQPDGEPPGAAVDLHNDAVILYTSGTTARPKGVVLTHGSITFNVLNQLAHVDVLSTDVALCTAPLFHATGLGQVSLPTMFKGGTVVVAPAFDPSRLLRLVGELRINAFSAVPTMLQLLCDHPDWAVADLSSLRYVNYGGSPMLARVAAEWARRGVEVVQGYGMTEAAPGVTMELPPAADRTRVSAGVPHFFTDIDLLPGPTGAADTGELAVRGPHLFRGYWRDDPATAAALSDGWFASGDVLSRDADGSYAVVDRIKDLIISGGENIYPGEVEAAIAAHPAVADAAVVGVPDERWGEVGAALVVLLPGESVTADQLRSDLRATLAGFKLPRHLRFVEQIPRSPTGKTRRGDIRDLFAAEQPD